MKYIFHLKIGVRCITQIELGSMESNRKKNTWKQMAIPIPNSYHINVSNKNINQFGIQSYDRTWLIFWDQRYQSIPHVMIQITKCYATNRISLIFAKAESKNLLVSYNIWFVYQFWWKLFHYDLSYQTM